MENLNIRLAPRWLCLIPFLCFSFIFLEPIFANSATCSGVISGFQLDPQNGSALIDLNGQSLCTSDFVSSDVRIRALVSGSHESMHLSVTTPQGTYNKVENNITYDSQFFWATYPGTYTIVAELYSADNLSGILCETQTFSFVIEDCSVGSECNLVDNPNFDNGSDGWTSWTGYGAAATFSIDNSSQLSGANSYYVDQTAATGTSWHIETYSNDFSVTAGQSYIFSFEGRATVTREIQISLQRREAPWTEWGYQMVTLTPTATCYSFTITPDESHSNIVAAMFKSGNETGEFWIDNVSVVATNCTETCDGMISGFQLNPENGQALIDLNGQILCTSDFTSNDVRIRALVSGSHESMQLSVTTPNSTYDKTENFVTYDSHYFSADAPGTYTIVAKLYSGANLAGILCDEQTFSFVIEDCSVGSGCNLVDNPNFDNGTNGWISWDGYGAAATFSIDNTSQLSGVNSYYVNQTAATGTSWHTETHSNNFSVTAGQSYIFSFEGRATVTRDIQISLQIREAPWTEWGYEMVTLTPTATSFSFTITPNESHSNIVAAMFKSGNETGEFWIDNVSVVATNCTGSSTCEYTEISYDDFESGFGHWNDGGDDCHRIYEPGTGAGGSNYCIRTRDNSGAASSLYSDVFDCSNAQNIMIDFWYITAGMLYDDDFYLEFSNDGGNAYSTIQTWVVGQDFHNGIEYYESVTFTETFSNTCRLRLRCDAYSNYEHVYFDNIRIKICEPPVCSLTVDLGADISTCGQSSILTPNVSGLGSCTIGTASYNWSGPNSFSSTLGTITVSDSGLYMVTVTDCNGCTATDEVNVNSDVFTIACPADASISCTDSTSPASTGSATTNGDNCGVTTITYTDVPVGTCGSITRTWTATGGGESRDCVQNITVNFVAVTIDCDPTTSSPFLLGCDPTLTDGKPAIAATSVSGTDCAGAAITITNYTDDVQVNGCESTLTRSFSEFDACNNVDVTCDIVYIWTENANPMVTCPTIADVAYCDLGVFTAPEVTVSVSCGPTATIIGTYDPSSIDCTGGTFDVTYAYTGSCGSASTTCTVTVLPAAATTITCPTINPVAFCDYETFVPPVAIATIACGTTAEIVGVLNLETAPCAGGVFLVTYAYNGCGSLSTDCDVTIEAAPAPTFSCPSSLTILDCTGSVNDLPSTVSLIEACGETLDISDFTDVTNFPCTGGGNIEIIRTFNHTDVCGNSTSCTVTGLFNTPDTIAGTIAIDVDDSSCFDTGDTFLSGVTATLFQATGGIDLVTGYPTGPGTLVPGATAISDVNGEYLMELCGCVVGPLYVEFSGYTDLEPIVQDANCTTTINSFVNSTGISKTFLQGNTIDFPNLVLVSTDTMMSVGTTVWLDDNANGIQDVNETGFSIPVPLDLYESPVDTIVATATTDPFDGSYIFQNVAPGDYYIQFTAPTGFISTPVDFAFDDNVDANDNGIQNDTNGNGVLDEPIVSNVFNLTPGQEPLTESGPNGNADISNDKNGDMTIDFGLTPVGGIGKITGSSGSVLELQSTSIVPTDAKAEAKVSYGKTEAKVYPNPVMDILFLDISTPKIGLAKAAMFSILGELVLNIDDITLAEGSNLNKINVSGLKAGTYVLRIEIGEEIFLNKVTVIE